MGTDRCFACCQENCGYSRCYCPCHGPRGMGPLAIANERAGKMIRDAVELIEDRKAFEQLDGKCPCKKHRTYRAIRKPTTSCEECWRFYVRMHP